MVLQTVHSQLESGKDCMIRVLQSITSNFSLNGNENFRSLVCRSKRTQLLSLIKEELFENVRHLDLNFPFEFDTPFTPQDLVYVFQLMPRLTRLSLKFKGPVIKKKKKPVGKVVKVTIDDYLKIQLQQGFAGLQYIKLVNCFEFLFNKTLAVYQEFLT